MVKRSGSRVLGFRDFSLRFCLYVGIRGLAWRMALVLMVEAQLPCTEALWVLGQRVEGLGDEEW